MSVLRNVTSETETHERFENHDKKRNTWALREPW